MNAQEQDTRQLPLEKIRILDLSRFIAGPHCTALLADMGADVIKVERPGGGDSRHVAPFYKGQAVYTMAFNRNKRAVTLNTRTAQGRELLRRLAGWADVVVENYRPGTMERMGLGFDELRHLNPRVILTSISGFGQTGPERESAMVYATASLAEYCQAVGVDFRPWHRLADVLDDLRWRGELPPAIGAPAPVAPAAARSPAPALTPRDRRLS